MLMEATNTRDYRLDVAVIIGVTGSFTGVYIMLRHYKNNSEGGGGA